MENNRNAVAIVVDGKVEEIFECDERMAALLLSNPLIVDITNRKHIIDSKGILYDVDTDLFYKRVDVAGQARPGIVTWPTTESGTYNHSAAMQSPVSLVSNIRSVQEINIEPNREGVENKPCGCKG